MSGTGWKYSDMEREAVKSQNQAKGGFMQGGSDRAQKWCEWSSCDCRIGILLKKKVLPGNLLSDFYLSV